MISNNCNNFWWVEVYANEYTMHITSMMQCTVHFFTIYIYLHPPKKYYSHSIITSGRITDTAYHLSDLITANCGYKYTRFCMSNRISGLKQLDYRWMVILDFTGTGSPELFGMARERNIQNENIWLHRELNQIPV